MQRWTNWGRTVSASPSSVVTPSDTDELATALEQARHAGRTVRALGSGHSFSGIGSPETGCAVDLSRLSGIIHADPDTGLVTVHAGTPLHQLNADLDTLGLAMVNLGDIDRQTVAGAISTGTHGTGAELGGLATQVTALELMRADGVVVRCSAEQNAELFEAARLGLGALGVITTVTLRCTRAFTLAAEERRMRFDEVLHRFDEFAATNDHFEFHWFPHSEQTLVKRNNRHDGAPEPLSTFRHFLEYEVLENAVFGAVCEVGRTAKPLVRPLNRLCAAAWSARTYRDRSYRVFTTPRRVRFVETEYAFPRERIGPILRELRAVARRLSDPVMVPVEVRVAAADDVWLSTAYQRPTAYVAVHQYRGMPRREWFDAFETLAAEHDGRPHWGKMHSLGADTLRDRYPRFDDFRRVRASVDPDGLFDSAYLRRVLGPVDNSC